MNKEYHIIGLMSGTSLDGVDIVKCTFVNNGDWSFILNKFETIHYLFLTIKYITQDYK